MVSDVIVPKLLNTSVTPASSKAGALTAFNASFTVVTSVDATAVFVVVFPTEFDLSGIQVASLSGTAGTASATVSGTTVAIARSSGATVAANTFISIVLSNVRVRGVSGESGDFQIYTQNSHRNFTHDEDLAVKGFTISPGDIVAAVAFSSVRSYATTVVSLTLALSNEVPQTGAYMIVFPAGVTFVSPVVSATGDSSTLAVTVSNATSTLVVNRTSASSAIARGSTVTLTISGLRNRALSGVLTALQVSVLTNAGSVIDRNTSVAAPSITTNDLLVASVAPFAANVGRSTQYWFAFTTSSPLPPSFIVEITFPSGTSIAAVSAASGISGGVMTPTVIGQVLTLAVLRAAEIPAGATLNITVSGVVNNPAGTQVITPFTIKTADSSNVAIDLTTSLTTFTLTPEVLSVLALSVTSNLTGDDLHPTFSLTTVNPIPATGCIVVSLPTDFSLSSPALTLSSGLTGAALTTSANDIRVCVSAQVAAGTAISFKVSGILNPDGSMTTSAMSVKTSQSTLTLVIDSGAFVPVQIVPSSFSAASVTFSSNVVYAVTSVTIAITNKNRIPVGGRFLVYFPAGIDISSASVSSSSGFDGSVSIGATSAASNVLALNRTGGVTTVTASTALTIVLGNIRNRAFSGTVEGFRIQSVTALSLVMDQSLSVSSPSLVAGAITDASVTPEFLNVGRRTNYTVSFRNSAPLAASSIIQVTLPSGTNLTSLSGIATVLPSGVTFSSSVTGTVVSVAISATVSASQNITFVILNINNRNGLSGATGVYTIRTITAAGAAIDENTAVAQSVLIPGQLTSISLTLSNSVAGNYSVMFLQFTTTNPIPSDGALQISLPNGFSVTSLYEDSTRRVNANSFAGTFVFNFTTSACASPTWQNCTVFQATRASTGFEFAAGTVGFYIGGILNAPLSGVSGVFGLSTLNSGGVVIDQETSIAGVTLVAAASSYVDGTDTIFAAETVSFTLVVSFFNILPPGAFVTVTLPSSLAASGSTTGAVLPSGEFSYSYISATQVNFTRSAATIHPRATNVSFTLGGISSRATSGLVGSVSVSSFDSRFILMDTGTFNIPRPRIIYRSPLVSSVSPVNFPKFSSSSVTVFGRYFAPIDSSVKASIGSTAVVGSHWTSDSAIVSLPARSSGISKSIAVSVESQMGQMTNMFSFDLVTISSLKQNAPTTGALVSLFGSNFGSFDMSVRVRVGHTATRSTNWVSDTHVIAHVSHGVGISRAVVASIEGSVRTSSPLFSFDIVSLSSVSSILLATSGDVISFFGANFGTFDVSVRVRVGGTGCMSTTWTADTAVVGRVAAGVSTSLSVVVSIANVAATSNALISFFGPTITSLSSVAFPTTGSSFLTVFGSYFALADYSLRASVGGTAMELTQWQSDTSFIAKIGRGVGLSLHATVSVGAQRHTFVGALTFSSPVMLSIDVLVLHTTGAASLTVAGRNFGSFDTTLRVRIGGTSCEASLWRSDSSISCKYSVGVSSSLSIAATIYSQRATLSMILSYAAPLLSSSNSILHMTSGSSSVTVLGSLLGTFDSTVRVRIGGTAGEATSWISDSSVRVKISAGVASSLTAVATVTSLRHSLLSLISYRGPVVTSFTLPMPSTGSAVLSLFGAGFGSFDYTIAARVGQTSAQFSNWLSDSSLTVKSSAGLGASLPLKVTVGLVRESSTLDVSYVSPLISSLSHYCLPTLPSAAMTVFGAGFGIFDLSVRVRVGGTSAEQTSWTSDSSAAAKPASGSGGSKPVVMSASLLSSTSALFFSYSSPIVTASHIPFVAATGSGVLTLFGANFAGTDASVSVRLGSTACPSSHWLADTSIICKVSAGVGSSFSVTVSLSRLVAASFLSISYSSPTITSHSNGALPTTGSAVLLVTASNLGTSDFSIRVRVGSTACEVSLWTSDSSVSCKVSSGLRSSLDLSLSLLNSKFMISSAFSYSSVATSSLAPSSLAASGSHQLTIFAAHLGVADFSPIARVGLTTCEASRWHSDSSLYCKLSAGLGGSLSAIISLASVSTLSRAFSFSLPTASSMLVLALPSTGGDSATVFGSDFGVFMQSQQVRVGFTACSASVWTSDSSIFCKAASGIGRSLSVKVTALHQVSSSPLTISYLQATLSSIVSNVIPSTGSLLSSLFGSGYGVADHSVRARVGGTSCELTGWVSDSSLVCKAPSGLLQSRLLVVSVSQSASFQSILSYSQALLSSLNPLVMQSSGSFFTLFGSSFGVFDSTVSVRLGASATQSSVWLSDSSIFVRSSSGIGQGLSVTTSILSRTSSSLFSVSFSSPLMSSGSAQLPTTGSLLMTVFGFQFGFADYSVRVRVGGTAAEASSWQSDTSVIIKSSSGISLSKGLIVSLLSSPFSILNAFSFSSPSVLAVSSSPTTGSFLISLAGSHFGVSDYSLAVRIGSTACEASVWKSDSSVLCKSPNGVGLQHSAFLSLANSVFSGDKGFSYSPAGLSSASVYYVPLAGGGLITVFGTNFGVRDISVQARLGSTSCEFSHWVSDSSVRVRSPAGVGGQLSFLLSVAVNVGVVSRSFSYSDPVISSVLSLTVPTTGSSVTIYGGNFGAWDISASARIGQTRCESTFWISDSAVKCKLAGGIGVSLDLSVTTTGQVGLFASSVSYNGPTLTSATPRVLETTGSYSLTVFGSGFGIFDLTTRVRIGGTSAMSSLWISDSCLFVKQAAGVGESQSVTITAAVQKGSSTSIFSFAKAFLSSLSFHALPTTGSFSIVARGGRFGVNDYSMRSRIGYTACESSEWMSDSSLICKSPSGTNRNVVFFVSLSNSVVTTSQTISYHSPAITNLRGSSPSTGSSTLTISGSSFGIHDSTVKSRIGHTSCEFTSWTSDSSLHCKNGAGIGKNIAVVTTVSQSLQISTQTYSYFKPTITAIIQGIIPTTGGFSVTVIGLGYGVSDYSVRVRVGGTGCEGSVWVSDSSAVCKVGSGVGVGRDVVSSAGGQHGTLVGVFSFVGAGVTSLVGTRGMSTGGFSVTVVGLGYGVSDYSVRVRVGGTGCEGTVWVSDSSAVCKVGAGLGSSRLVVLSSSGFSSIAVSVFSFVSPFVSSSSQTVLSPFGSDGTFLFGAGFGVFDGSPRVRFGLTSCASSRWISDSNVFCRTSSGVGLSQNFVVSSGGSTGTFLSSYLSPFVSTISPDFAYVTVSTNISIFGRSFGALDYSPSMSFGSGSARTMWTSDSSMVALFRPSTLGFRNVSIVLVNDTFVAGNFSVISYPADFYPVSVLSLAATQSACDDVILDGSLSYGLGRSSLQFVFTVLSNSSFVTSGHLGLFMSTSRLNLGKLSPGSYVFQLYVQNYLGLSSVSNATIAIVDQVVPQVSIAGGSTKLRCSTDIQMDASVTYASCVNGTISSQVSAWSVGLGAGSLLKGSLSSFFISKDSLAAGGTYNVTLIVSATYLGARIVGSQSVSLECLRSAPVAVISGGSSRVSSRDEPLVIDGSSSVDVDSPASSALLRYVWNCTTSDAAGNYSCPQRILSSLLPVSVLSLPSSALVAGETISFSLTVVHNVSLLSSVATTDVFIVSGSPPRVSITGPTSKVSISSLLSLTASAVAVNGTVSVSNISWSIVSGPTSILSPSNLQSSTFGSVLVIKSSVLSPGTSYRFRASAFYEGNTGFSDFTLATFAIPSSGTFIVSPVNGTDTTSFAMSFEGWDGDSSLLPLRFYVSRVDGDSELPVVGISTQTARNGLLLPAGSGENGTLSLVGYIVDQSGTSVAVSRTVFVTRAASFNVSNAANALSAVDAKSDPASARALVATLSSSLTTSNASDATEAVKLRESLLSTLSDASSSITSEVALLQTVQVLESVTSSSTQLSASSVSSAVNILDSVMTASLSITSTDTNAAKTSSIVAESVNNIFDAIDTTDSTPARRLLQVSSAQQRSSVLRALNLVDRLSAFTASRLLIGQTPATINSSRFVMTTRRDVRTAFIQSILTVNNQSAAMSLNLSAASVVAESYEIQTVAHRIDPFRVFGNLGGERVISPIFVANVRSFRGNVSQVNNVSLNFSVQPLSAPQYRAYRCVWFDELQGRWSDDGVTTRLSGGNVVCQSSHLTAFTVQDAPIGCDSIFFSPKRFDVCGACDGTVSDATRCNSPPDNNYGAIIIGAIVGGVVFIIVFVAMFLYLRVKKPSDSKMMPPPLPQPTATPLPAPQPFNIGFSAPPPQSQGARSPQTYYADEAAGIADYAVRHESVRISDHDFDLSSSFEFYNQGELPLSEFFEEVHRHDQRRGPPQ